MFVRKCTTVISYLLVFSIRYQRLYENVRQELNKTKEILIAAEMEVKKYKNMYNDQDLETQRMDKLLKKKDLIINQLNLEIDKAGNKDHSQSSDHIDSLISSMYFFNNFNLI